MNSVRAHNQTVSAASPGTEDDVVADQKGMLARAMSRSMKPRATSGAG